MKQSQSRTLTIVTYEPSEFIGHWSSSTSSYELRVPGRPATTSRPARPWQTALGDIAIVLFALVMIFSIPGLVIFATMH